MKINCDFYYKCITKEGVRYFGICLHTKDQKVIDMIMDEINSVNGSFVTKDEFYLHSKNIMVAGIMDNDNKNLIVADVLFDNMGVIKIYRC